MQDYDTLKLDMNAACAVDPALIVMAATEQDVSAGAVLGSKCTTSTLVLTPGWLNIIVNM